MIKRKTGRLGATLFKIIIIMKKKIEEAKLKAIKFRG